MAENLGEKAMPPESAPHIVKAAKSAALDDGQSSSGPLSSRTQKIEIGAHEEELSSDILLGAVSIAVFMFGDPKKARKVYHLFETSNAPIFFKLGSMICARRSVVLRWIRQQECRFRDLRRGRTGPIGRP